MLSTLLVLAAATGLASAHYELQYPTWRADALTNTNYSEWDYPCAGVPQDAWGANRTDWPITGGSLKLGLHHPWTYIFINLGLGDNVTNFNYSLTPAFWNETGKGSLCVDHIDLPADLDPIDGQNATLQVITLGESGSALYSCADITFRAGDVANYGGEMCVTDDGVSFTIVQDQANATTASSATPSAASSAASATTTGNTATADTSAGSATGVNTSVVSSVVALALVFMYGMSM